MLKSLIFIGFAVATVSTLAVDLETDLDEEDVLNEEALLSEEARGLLSKDLKNQIGQCLGKVRNKFLTKITTKQEFIDCIKSVCTEGLTSDKGGMDDDTIERVVTCVGLEEGMGPGPGDNGQWRDGRNRQKMMVMANRGKLGFCLRYDGRKC